MYSIYILYTFYMIYILYIFYIYSMGLITCALASQSKRQREEEKDDGQTSASRIIMEKE